MANYRGVKLYEATHNSANHADLWPLKICLNTSSSFLLITQYEMPFINKSEATKWLKDWKTNGKCTSGMNCRSHVWPVYFIYRSTEAFSELEALFSAKTNSGNRLFPKPVGSTPKTSFPLRSDCSAFKTNPKSLISPSKSTSSVFPWESGFPVKLIRRLYLFDEVWLTFDDKLHQD